VQQQLPQMYSNPLAARPSSSSSSSSSTSSSTQQPTTVAESVYGHALQEETDVDAIPPQLSFRDDKLPQHTTTVRIGTAINRYLITTMIFSLFALVLAIAAVALSVGYKSCNCSTQQQEQEQISTEADQQQLTKQINGRHSSKMLQHSPLP